MIPVVPVAPNAVMTPAAVPSVKTPVKATTLVACAMVFAVAVPAAAVWKTTAVPVPVPLTPANVGDVAVTPLVVNKEP